MDEPLCTRWIDWTPTPEATRKAILIEAVVLALASLTVPLLLDTMWVLLPILVGVVAILMLMFDSVRLGKGETLRRGFRFDERRIYEVWHSSKSGEREGKVIAFDGLRMANVSHGSIGLYEFGADFPREIIPLEWFPSRSIANALLERLRARDVQVEVEGDSLESASFGLDVGPSLR